METKYCWAEYPRISYLGLLRNPGKNNFFEFVHISIKILPRFFYKQLLERVYKSEDGQKLLEDRPRLQLSKYYGGGTLGAVLVDWYSKRKLQPISPPDFVDTSSDEYLVVYLYETHDVFHVLTGFETDAMGEACLMAFYAAQLPCVLSYSFFMFSAARSVVDQPTSPLLFVRKIIAAWKMGKKARKLITVDWNCELDSSILDIRKRYF